MWPHRSQREWEVSHRIVEPQLSHSMPSMEPVFQPSGVGSLRLAEQLPQTGGVDLGAVRRLVAVEAPALGERAGAATRGARGHALGGEVARLDGVEELHDL